jgi:nucleoside 2-deoxyribosyltransferase
MKIYLAADIKLQAKCKAIRKELADIGIEVNSRWLDEDLENPTYPMLDCANRDIQDITETDHFVLYNPLSHQKQGTGGRHFETGYAYHLGKPILCVAEQPESIFHLLPGIALLQVDCATMSDQDLAANIEVAILGP